MKIIKCVVVDDEPPAIRLVENYIKRIPFLELVYTTTKPLELITFMEKEDFDVIFLDIQMPGITGIQLSKIIKKKINVIFTTAYSEFAVESYNLNATDYLLKPFEFERFYQAIQKVSEEIVDLKTTNNEYVFVKTDSRNNFEKILVKDIVYIEGLKNYVAIHLANKQIITYNTLKSIKASLPDHLFIQIHKSYIVGITHIDTTSSMSIILNGIDLPIGNSYKSSFFERIGKNKL